LDDLLKKDGGHQTTVINTEKENIHLDNGHSFIGVLSFDEVKVSTKEGSEISDEIVSRFREIRSNIIERFIWSVGIRRPEEEAVMGHAGNSVETVVIIRSIYSAESKEGLGVADERDIITASHTRKRVR